MRCLIADYNLARNMNVSFELRLIERLILFVSRDKLLARHVNVRAGNNIDCANRRLNDTVQIENQRHGAVTEDRGPGYDMDVAIQPA